MALSINAVKLNDEFRVDELLSSNPRSDVCFTIKNNSLFSYRCAIFDISLSLKIWLSKYTKNRVNMPLIL